MPRAASVGGAMQATEFDDVFGEEAIELFLATSYDQFADRAKFNHFLPLMAERFVRQRLKALAKIERKAADGLPTLSCSSAPTTQGAARWPWDGSNDWLATEPWPGPAAPNRGSKSTPPPSAPSATKSESAWNT